MLMCKTPRYTLYWENVWVTSVMISVTIKTSSPFFSTCTCRSYRKGDLQGFSVYVSSSHKKFQEEWSFILKLAGCHVLQKLPAANSGETLRFNIGCYFICVPKCFQENCVIQMVSWKECSCFSIDTWAFHLQYCIELSSVPVSDTPVNVIVTDLTCPKTVLRRSRKSAIPLVASEWVMQCLINGKRLSFTGHPRYSYDFNSWRIVKNESVICNKLLWI
jgi:hypothetical protein